MLADLLLQDIEDEPEDGGGPAIRRGTSKDRIVSTTDPEMRHGRKCESKNFNGYKASIVAETESGVILATDARSGNVHDAVGAVELVAEAVRTSGKELGRVLGDTAYGSTETVRELEELGAEVIAKAPPANVRGACFTLDSFKIDSTRGEATCPAGKRSIRRDRVTNTSPEGWRYTFSRNDCNACPIRAKCTTAKVTARTVTVTDHTVELQRRRKKQRTKKFKEAYRRRVVVEHRIGRLAQLGIRQARYLGRSKVAFQVSLLATIANLGLAAAKAAHWRNIALRRSTAVISGFRNHIFEALCAISANVGSETRPDGWIQIRA